MNSSEIESFCQTYFSRNKSHTVRVDDYTATEQTIAFTLTILKNGAFAASHPFNLPTNNPEAMKQKLRSQIERFSALYINKRLFSILAFLLLTIGAFAQTGTNCFYSTDYYYTNSRMEGVKKLKTKSYFCFNNNTATVFTQELGIITFTYRDIASGFDSTAQQVWWEGSNGDYHIVMTYNHLIKIERNDGAWCVWLWTPCNTENGCVDYKRKQTHKEYPRYSPAMTTTSKTH